MVDYSRTDIFAFRKTNVGSIAWGFDANNNFDILDALLSEQHNADGSHKNILTDDLTASGVSTFGDVIITGNISMAGGFLIDEVGHLYVKNYMPYDASGNLIGYPAQAYFAKNGDVTQPIGLFFDDQVIARSSFADEIDSDYAPKIAARYASGNKSPFIQVFSENVSNEYEEELALCEKDNYNLVMKKSNKVVFKDSTAYVGEIYRNDNELYIYDSDDIIIESVAQTSVKGYKVRVEGTAESSLQGAECGALASVEAYLDSEGTIYTYGVTGTTFEDDAKVDILTPITTIKSSNYTRIRNTAGTTKIDVDNNGNILMASTVDCKIETPVTIITSSDYTRIRNSANTTQINVENAGDVGIVTATNFETDSAKSVLMASDYVRLRNTAGTTKIQVNNGGDIDIDSDGDTTISCDGEFNINTLATDANLFGITTIGNVSMPKQSHVYAVMSGDQAGFASGTFSQIIFGTKGGDPQSEYNATTGAFTAAEDGVYHIDVAIYMGTVTTTGRVSIAIKVDGTEKRATSLNVSTGNGCVAIANISLDYPLTAGQVVTIWGRQLMTSGYATMSVLQASSTFMNIRKVI